MRTLRAVPHLALLATLVATAGCAGFWRSWSVAPNGLAKPDDHLRRDLAAARYADALERLGPDGDAAPDDELLRLLYDGVVAHYAGRYGESSDSLDRAAALAEDRYTLSASRGALSLVSSDRSLQFRPNRTERLLIHYYGALNYLQQADVEGAAVEARRLSALLQRYDDDGWDCERTRLCAALRYFAGAVFEAAGEWNDADVAYRHAAALAEQLSPTTPADSGGAVERTVGVGAPGPVGSSSTSADSATGDVLLVLERGFVAHRVEESVTVVLNAEEAAAMQAGDAGERLAISTLVAARLLGEDTDEPGRGRRGAVTVSLGDEDTDEDRSDDRDGERDDDCDRGRQSDRGAGRADDDECERDPNPYLLRVAWPSYRDEYEPSGRAVLLGPDGRRAEAPALADVSAAVMGEFADERLEVVARAIARAAAKFATVRAVESGVAEGDDGLGRVLGLITNIGGALLERADTRSWHLLPDAIGIARMRLPAGSHTLELALNDGRGRESRRIPVGPVEIRAGAITVVSARVWR